MRVLITGIDGFVGSHLAGHLLRVGGVEVFGTSLSEHVPPPIAALQPSIAVRTLDILYRENVRDIITTVRPDRIIHLAAQTFVPASVRDPLSTFQVNITGTLHILEALREIHAASGKAAHLLFISTGEVYGRGSGSPVTEDFPLRPANPYASSKASADLITQQYGRTFGFPVTVVRPFNHVGPHQSSSFVCSSFARQFAEILEGRRVPVLQVGNLEASRDFTDVRDVVQAYWKLFDRTTPEIVFNVCSGISTSIREILSMLMAATGLTVTIEQEAGRMRSYDVAKVVGDSKRLQHATGWKPGISLEQSLSDLVAYWRSHPDLRTMPLIR